ncbi:Syndecan domain containing protein, partial [Trichuris trichiura]
DFDEGSGKTGASDIDDGASGYGPDDEDSDFAWNSCWFVSFGVMQFIIFMIIIIITAVIGGSVVGLLVAILLITLVVYRMRKKDEGSYALDESKTPPAYPYAYHKAPTREFYA